MAEQPLPCSSVSIAANEPLAGTAPRTSRWVLVEYAGAWAPKILNSEDFPEAVREKLRAWSEGDETGRVQWIRQSGFSGVKPKVFFGSCEPGDAWLITLELDFYDQLLAIDFDSVFEQRSHPDANKVEAPLHLVCVHGKRDRCCAQFGSAVYRAMADEVGSQVWQTSHLGGHRYAAVTLVLPEGICYGRIRGEQASELVEAHRHDALYRADSMRGRCGWDAPTQAAEVFLRQDGSIDVSMTLSLESSEASGNEEWQVLFSSPSGTHRVGVRRTEDTDARHKSCDGHDERCYRFVRAQI